MKRFKKEWIFVACNAFISLGHIMHWTKVSLLLFGEQPYPENPEA